MERLKCINNTLIDCVSEQICDLNGADYHELGAAIDMIKDVSKAMYYMAIIKAMEADDEHHDSGHEGRSPKCRRAYMEAKQMHHSTETKMHELEKYAAELTQDLMDMIADASVEEKQMLHQKIATLATKI